MPDHYVPFSFRAIFETLAVADRSQGGVEGLADLIAGQTPWSEGLASCIAYVCDQRMAAERAVDEAQAERDDLRERLDALTEVDQEWARRLADEHRAAVAKVAEYGERIDQLQTEVVRYRAALALIAAPQRPDGSWNRDREACRQIAQAALNPEAEEATP